MDPRFEDSPIFKRRREEWTADKIESYIGNLFSKVEMVKGWKFVGTQWQKPQKVNKEELKKHILRILRVKVTNPQEEELSYDIQVPELVHNQFFYIGGYLKIPMFQLYDPPVIYRKNILKLRTNTLTANLNIKKGNDIHLFNKQLPLDLLLTIMHTKEEIDEFITPLLDSEEVQAIQTKCQDRFDTSELDDRILELGNYFSVNNGDQMKKGRGIIFSLKAAYEVDIFNQQFFETESILFEIIKHYHDGVRSDTDVRSKRIRFTEYILAPLIRKIYDMLLTINSTTKAKFQIPQTILFEGCNKSEIVRFSFPVNPVSEIASMCQCTLTGPGGFKKDNVPGYLRNLDDSQFGRICPVDTPDRSGCGVTLNMVPTTQIDELGRFGTATPEIVTSYPITLTPFMMNDDQTRLQMASNQAKQSIMLKYPEPPIVRAGTERLFLDETTFFKRADKSGSVIYLDGKIMIVSYDDNTIDVFDIGYRNIFQGAIDILKPCRHEGDTFQEGDVLYESHFIKDEMTCLGQNLNAGIMIWEGFNYEDGIVISRSVSEKKFTSIHFVDLTIQIDPSQVLLSLVDDDYRPLPTMGSRLKKGEAYAKLKTIDKDEGFESINMEPTEICSPLDCKIVDIEIYPNYWNKQVKEYDSFVQSSLMVQSERYAIIESKIREATGAADVSKLISIHGLSKSDCLGRKGKYSFKGQKLKGIMIKIRAIYEEQIGIGDKIANRHGNKGVISKIEDDENMPQLPDGRRLDILLNPLGIISRMNAGQLYELHTGEATYKMSQKIKELWDIENRKPCRDFYEGFLALIDKTPDRWITTSMLNYFDFWMTLATDATTFANKIMYVIQPPFQSMGPEDLNEVMQYCGADYKYKLNLTEANIEIENPIACGYMYFEKLIHRSTDKISARSIGPYSKKTLQPLGGKSRQGGHRCGEMEVWALMAHGATNLIHDFLTVQSDSPGLKNKLLAEILENPELADSDDGDMKPQSLRLLESYFKVLGLEITK